MAPRRSSRLARSTDHDIADYFESSSAPSIHVSSQGAATAQRLDPDALCLFDLPGEIRNQIYDELLPDETMKIPEYGRAFRSDGQKTSTIFMATCRRVYEEASSILYGALNLERIELTAYDADSVSFWGYNTSLDTATAANFLVLRRVRTVHLDVHQFIEEAHESSCGLQDALFLIMSNLRAGHKVRSLEVDLSVGENEDYYNDVTPGSDSFTFYGRQLTFAEKIMREFKKVKPGDFSRAHVTAFLTDALRLVRGISKGKNNFILTFIGQSGRPWRDIPNRIRGTVQGHSPVENFTIFSAYFSILRQLKKTIINPDHKELEMFRCWYPRQRQYCHGKGPERRIRDLADDLGAARIKGQIREFKHAHEKLLEAVAPLLSIEHEFEDAEPNEQAGLREQWWREMIYLSEQLKDHLPDDSADTSFFGYRLADEALREWQTHGREEEKQAKKKRKAEREAKGKVGKKAKTTEEE